VPRIIYMSVPLLHILQQREQWDDCARLLGAILHYPNTWELVKQHPVVQALPVQLEAELGADRFRSLSDKGQHADLPALVTALIDGLAAGG
jgi:hypothetical protein